MLSEKLLQKVHVLELKIAIEIKRICEKHEIPYFLLAGSALGAVRHGGFIPWDEDMDIGMRRPDYERFLAVCETDLGSEFFLHTWDTDPDYPFSFAKVRLNGTHFVEAVSKDAGLHDGIFVDIFPFDNAPDRAFQRRLQGIRYALCKRLLWIKKGFGTNMKETRRQAVRYYLFLLFSKLFPYEAVKSYFRKVETKFNHKTTAYMAIDGSYTYERETIRREWAENLIPIQFESEEFPIYQNYHAYLEHMYGDYMQLPPMELRDKHELLHVDFGSYQPDNR